MRATALLLCLPLLAPADEPMKVADPMAGFAPLVGDGWWVTGRSGESMYHT